MLFRSIVIICSLLLLIFHFHLVRNSPSISPFFTSNDKLSIAFSFLYSFVRFLISMTLFIFIFSLLLCQRGRTFLAHLKLFNIEKYFFDLNFVPKKYVPFGTLIISLVILFLYSFFLFLCIFVAKL